MTDLPPGFDAANVPAWAIEATTDKRALCWHPLGLEHPNARALIERLQRRGFVVLNAPRAA